MKSLNLVLLASAFVSASAMAGSVVLPGDAMNVKVNSFIYTDIAAGYAPDCTAQLDGGQCLDGTLWTKGAELHIGYQSAVEGRARTAAACMTFDRSCAPGQNDYQGQTFETVVTYAASELNAVELSAAKAGNASIVSLNVETAAVANPAKVDTANSTLCPIDPSTGTQVNFMCKEQDAYKASHGTRNYTFVDASFNQ